MFGLQVVHEKTDRGLRLREPLLGVLRCRQDSVTDGLQHRVLKCQIGSILLCSSLHCMAKTDGPHIKHMRFKEELII